MNHEQIRGDNMQVFVEATGSLERKIRVEVPEEKIAAEIQNRLQSISRTSKIQGFRRT